MNRLAYEDGTQQDLRATPTAWFNPSPAVLVEQPTATLGRSALTSDGEHALYFTNVGSQGGTLHVASIDGSEDRTLNGIDAILAAGGSQILVTDHKTDPDVYPVLVDLRMLDTANDGLPSLIEEGIVDGRTIQLTADKERVAYIRPGGADEGGIWLRPLP